MAIQTCYFDIETSNLNADFGVILCACIKGDGKPVVTLRGDRLVPGWSAKRSDDGPLVAAIAKELSKYDLWVAHNGQKFDIPFINTRLMASGQLPLARPKVLIDPVWVARNNLRMSYNSLDKLSSVLGVNSKTEVDPAIWLRATLDGDKKAMNYIVEHCVQDVITLDKVVDKLKHLCSAFNNWGSSR
jgi:uncharacterized protein YprB with RNaseH-like and TPR domain